MKPNLFKYATNELSQGIIKHSNTLNIYKIKFKTLFAENNENCRIDYTFMKDRKEESIYNLKSYLEETISDLELIITEKDKRIFENFLLGTLSQKILGIIHNSKSWIN